MATLAACWCSSPPSSSLVSCRREELPALSSCTLHACSSASPAPSLCVQSKDLVRGCCGRQQGAQQSMQLGRPEEVVDCRSRIWPLREVIDRNRVEDGGVKQLTKQPAEMVIPVYENELRVVDPLQQDPPCATSTASRTEHSHGFGGGVSSSGEDDLWLRMRVEARRDAEAEPVLASFLYSTILAHRSLDRALAFHLGNKLASTTLLSTHLVNLMLDTFMMDADIRDAVRADIRAVRERDPACVSYSHCMLNFKGFLACQAHRVAHRLWRQGRSCLALALQSRVSEQFHVDIHPAAKIGKGILFDHATGVVVGETAVIGNNVSLLHNVTLGGTGAFSGDRHPRIGDGVLVGAGSILLGPITVGEGANIGAGSLLLTDVPPYTTAVGNPARLVRRRKSPEKPQEVPSRTMDHTSFMERWSGYVI